MGPLAHRLPVLAALLLLLLLRNAGAQQPMPVLINCGSAESATATADGRRWVGDDARPGGNFTPTLPGTVAVAPAPGPGGEDDAAAYGALYRTARVFNASSSYLFRGVPVPGTYFLRLHFSRLLSRAEESVFDVGANGLKLLTKFNVPGEIARRNRDAKTSSNSTGDVVVKEYLLNVSEPLLEVEFAPDAGSFAFVNAIELVPVPAGAIFGSVNTVGDGGVVGLVKAPLFSLGGGGVETMYRVSVGGGGIGRAEDPRLWRRWDSDDRYIFSQNAARTVRNSSTISYVTSDDDEAASFSRPPLRLYETARVTEETFVVGKKFNVSWSFGVDPGFAYLVRLHFCELEADQRRFRIYVDGRTAAESYDVLARAGGKNRAFHEDFLDAAPAQADTLWVQLGSEASSAAGDALLNGMEIFKVSRDGVLGHPTMRIGGISGGAATPRRSAKWVLVGAAAGLVMFISVAAAAVYFCFYMRRKRNSSSPEKSKAKDGRKPLALRGAASTFNKNSRSSPTLRATGTFGSCRMGRQFSIAEIRAATMNFDESLVIGVGGFGKVYKGELENGTLVAIKRGHSESQQGAKEFETEIEMLSRLRHRHLVSLIGYCDDHNEMVLVYEHMANGTLRHHLYGREEELPALSWRQRLEICVGAARGLHYLHTGLERGIIHRDVKTTNILLDDGLVAKVADFGISKDGPPLDHTHVSTAVKGSFGYLDPEYFRRQQLTQSSDVYSFGVVLFEVLCARPVIIPGLPRDQINLAEWALKWQRQNSVEAVIDPRLNGDYTLDSVKQFGEIAEKCLADEGRSRPSMGEVLWHLESALQLHQAHLQSSGADDGVSVPELELAVASTSTRGMPV